MHYLKRKCSKCKGTIFNKHVVPHLEKSKSFYFNTELKYEGIGESYIAANLIELRKEYPQIWIKTLPFKSPRPPIRGEMKLTVFIDSDNYVKTEIIKEEISELGNKIIKILNDLGGKILEN